MKNKLKELIEQAIILAGKKTSESVAEYLAENNVVALPVGVGDKVWFIAAKGRWGTLLTTGVPVKRTVDAVIYDGKRLEQEGEQ